jgi:tetratricopeptide (TPR) repeat protein
VLLVVFRDTAVVARAPVFIGASTADRLLTMTTVIPDYARLLLVPVRLSAEYVPAVIDLATSVTWGVVMGVLLAAALAAAIFLAWRRAPEAALALAWVPVTLTPVSNVLIVTGVVLAERTLYLPSVGAMLAVGWAVERYGWRAPRGVGAAVALVLVLFAVRTWTRTDIWHDPKTFMLTNLEENPESYKAHWSIGRVDAAAGRLPDAENEYATARELFGRDAVLWRESGELKLKTEDWAGAAAMFARAFAVAPRDTMVADATWARAVLVKPDVWQLQVGYADFLLARGDTTSARAHADRAVELSAGAPPALAVRARAKGMTP